MRRRHLTEVAVRLITKKGFEALSVNEIAAEAQISIGGMYRYIRTKADLLVMACEDIFGGLREQMLKAIDEEQSIENKLVAAMRVYWLACHEREELIRLTYREFRSLPHEAKELYKQRELEISEVFRDLIRAGVITGEFRAVDDRVLAHEIFFMSHMWMFKHWALHDLDFDCLLDEYLELFLSRVRHKEPSGESHCE